MSTQEEIRRLDGLIVNDWPARDDVVCRYIASQDWMLAELWQESPA